MGCSSPENSTTSSFARRCAGWRGIQARRLANRLLDRDWDRAGRNRPRIAVRPTTWGHRYVGISLILVSLCLPAMWYFAGYHGEDFNKLLSFRMDDGWCVKGVESIGSHCFGDYAIFGHMDEGQFWDPDSQSPQSPTSYPPLSLVPMLAFLTWVGSREAGHWDVTSISSCSPVPSCRPLSGWRAGVGQNAAQHRF